jgi:hypothetical protein
VTTLTQPPLTAASVDDFVWKQWFQNTYRNVTELNEFAAGPIPIANGGTGETTANDAFNALAPSQSGAVGQFLSSTGTDAYWTILPKGRNRIVNGDFRFWQHSTDYTGAGGISGFYGMDMWWGIQPAVGYRDRRMTGAGLEGINYFGRFQRVPGSADNTLYRQLGYDLLTPDGQQLAGKTVTLSFYARRGANFSVSFYPVLNFFTGTGTDESARLVTLAGVVDHTSTIPTLTTSWQLFQYTFTCPTNTNEASVRWYWNHTGGAAGADDYWDLTGVQLEEGSAPTYFESYDPAVELLRCQTRFCKSFPIDTTPVVNLNSAERMYRMTAPVAGAVVTRGTQMVFPIRMRAIPTLTVYNPLAANNQAHDSSGALACTATSAVTQQQGFLIVTTGNAATAAGNSMVAGWTASAEI